MPEDAPVIQTVLLMHDALACTQNDVNKNPDISVWHMLASLLDFCDEQVVHFDDVLEQVREYRAETA